MNHYTVYLHAVKEHLDGLAKKLDESIRGEKAMATVSILKYPIRAEQHGQNPVDDCDGRSWVSVRNPDNEELFQPSQVKPQKFLFPDAEDVFREVARLIRTDTYRAIA